MIQCARWLHCFDWPDISSTCVMRDACFWVALASKPGLGVHLAVRAEYIAQPTADVHHVQLAGKLLGAACAAKVLLACTTPCSMFLTACCRDRVTCSWPRWCPRQAVLRPAAECRSSARLPSTVTALECACAPWCTWFVECPLPRCGLDGCFCRCH